MRELLAARAVDTPSNERPRRLRSTAPLRALVRETRLDPNQLVAPLFVVSGRGRRDEISSLKGHARLSPELAVAEAHRLAGLGVGAVLLFGIPDAKDPEGRAAGRRGGGRSRLDRPPCRNPRDADRHRARGGGDRDHLFRR